MQMDTVQPMHSAASNMYSGLLPTASVAFNTERIADPVASTSRWLAAARALESGRADGLFFDPFARALAGEEGFEFRDGIAPIAISRTKFFDDFILEVARAGDTQVVLLGAGMDTRSFRLDIPANTVIFEVDKAEVFDIKEPVLHSLQPTCVCKRYLVPCDLEEADWSDVLLRAGFDRNKMTMWVIEGGLHYLPALSVHCLLQKMSQLSPSGSMLVADMVNEDFMDSPATVQHRQDMASRGAPWKFGHNDPQALLEKYEFDAEVLDLSYLAMDRERKRIYTEYPRAVYDPSRRLADKGTKQTLEPLTFFITAVKG